MGIDSLACFMPAVACFLYGTNKYRYRLPVLRFSCRAHPPQWLMPNDVRNYSVKRRGCGCGQKRRGLNRHPAKVEGGICLNNINPFLFFPNSFYCSPILFLGYLVDRESGGRRRPYNTTVSMLQKCARA